MALCALFLNSLHGLWKAMKLIESQNFQEAANLEEGEKKRSGNEIKEDNWEMSLIELH